MRPNPTRRCLATALPALASLLLAPHLPAATGTHLPGSTLYPRLIRLHHAPGALRDTLLAKTGNKLFRSLDEGRTFTYLATVPTPHLAPDTAATPSAQHSREGERCCSTVYELPRKLGRFPAGTLLYSGSFFSGGIPSVVLYTSSDAGAHWRYLSTPMRSGDDHHGLWEPAFTTARDGSLLLFVSDETDPCCSQKLVQRRTSDGLHWQPAKDTVAGAAHGDRPGMAIVSPLPDGTWFMSYEVCGPATHCQVYTRTSPDGIDFGAPSSFGSRAVTTTGQYLAHAPLSIFDPVTRQLILSGQVLYERDGTVSPDNGRLLFTSTSLNGQEPWTTIPAPVAVPDAFDNPCPNYSSALLATRDGLLELASDYDTAHLCTSFFATRISPSPRAADGPRSIPAGQPK